MFKNKLFIKILGIVTFSSLVLIFIGQNCSRQNFSDSEYDSPTRHSQQQDAITKVDTKSVLISTDGLDLNDENVMNKLVSKVESLDGEIKDILPTGQIESEFSSVEKARSVVLNNNTALQQLGASRNANDINHLEMSPRTTNLLNKKKELNGKKFDPKKYKLLDFEKLKSRNSSSNIEIEMIELNNIAKARIALSRSKKKASEKLLGFSSYDLSVMDQFPNIGDQKYIGSCATWSTGYYMNSFANATTAKANVKEANSPFLCSPSFLYPIINYGVDSGSLPNMSFDVQMKMGCASTSILDAYSMGIDFYDINFFPSTEAQIGGLNNRIKNYRAVANAVDGISDREMTSIKNAILNGHLLSIAIFVYPNFLSYPNDIDNESRASCQDGSVRNNTQVYSDTYNCFEDPEESILGGHAVTIVGFDDNMFYVSNGKTKKGAFKIANSWSTDWGSQGFFWVGYDLFRRDPLKNNEHALLFNYPIYVIDDIRMTPKVQFYLKSSVSYEPPSTSSALVSPGKISVKHNNVELPQIEFVRFWFDVTSGTIEITPPTKFEILTDLSKNFVPSKSIGANQIVVSSRFRNTNTRVDRLELFVFDTALNKFMKVDEKAQPSNGQILTDFVLSYPSFPAAR
jgi:C1A family cysteine protease